MKNNSTDNFYHIGRAVQLLDDMYDLKIDMQKVREAAVRPLTNSRPFKVKTFWIRRKVVDFKIELPCSTAILDAVMRTEAMNNYFTTNRDSTMIISEHDFKNKRIITSIGGDVNQMNPDAIQYLRDWDFVDKVINEAPVEFPKNHEILSKPHNFYEDYSLDDNILSFNRNDIELDIFYTTILCDEEGFPFLSEKGILSVVEYMAYLDQLKKFYKKQGNENAVMLAKDNYERACARARTPEHINDNQADALMRTLLSNSRQFYGAPMKGY